MARVGNKKSRKGCLRCKHRKVKCDEVRPACGWCTSHATECKYPTPSGRRRSSISSASPTGSVLDSHRSIPAVASDSANMENSRLELGLFHYYVYTVARTFPYVDKERGLELHADIVPQASLRFPNLLNAMYSYALLHMHVQSSVHGIQPRNNDFFEDAGLRMTGLNKAGNDSKADLLSLHRDYLDKALQGQRGVVSGINEKNADGICIAAVLLAQVALVHSSQVRLSHEYCIPTDWFRLQSAFSSCLSASRHLLRMDSATSIMVHSSPSIDNRDLDRQVPGIFRWLLDWRPEESSMEHMNHQTKEAYRSCIVYVETIYKRIAEREPWQSLGRRILAFPSVGASTFLGLIEDHQPRALVILAHLLAMGKRLDGSWWIFQGVADYHVRGIAAIVPGEWQWALEWPIRVLETGAADECFQSGRGPTTVDAMTTPS